MHFVEKMSITTENEKKLYGRLRECHNKIMQAFPKHQEEEETRTETIELRREKTGLRDFRPGPTQTGLGSHRKWLEA